jgi:hypothetical protein
MALTAGALGSHAASIAELNDGPRIGEGANLPRNVALAVPLQIGLSGVGTSS